MNHSGLLLIGGWLIAASWVGAEPAADKTEYHLFHPTPAGQLRELSTDRPDQTESPYTVDAGHFQIEMDCVTATFDHDESNGADGRSEVWNVAPVNIKVGLLNNVDIQFVFDNYVHSRVDDGVAGPVEEVSGFGDISTRLKVNFWGNDGGKTAFAMMPFVKWPLRETDLRNGKTEGGVIFPLAIELAEGWGLGVQTEFDFVRNAANKGYDTEFVNSITIGHDVTEKLGMYVEFYTVTGSAPEFRWQGQVDVGWTYAVGENIQFDWGCNFGVTKSAPDFNPFVGLSWRL